VKNSGTGRKELLVTRNDKESRKIYRWMRYMLEEQELCRSPSRKADTKYDPRKTIKTH